MQRTFFKSSAYALLSLTLLFTACKTTYYHTGRYEPNMIAVNNSIAEDKAIVDYIAPYKQQLEAQMNRVIGTSEQLLSKSPRDGQNLGSTFFADALLALGKQIDPSVSCSVGTKDGIRTAIAKGNITVGNIFELMPFENYITILEIKGTDLLVLGDFIAKSNGQPIAGMSVVIDNKKLVEMRINSELVDVNKTYKLATYDYLANGGDHIQGLSHPINRVDTPTRVREGLIEYIETLTKQGQSINAELDGRIKIIQ